MNPDTIKDFLVGLGFKVDTNGLKTFMGTLEGVTKAALAVGVGVTAAAVATVKAVEIVSEQFEGLYYASQRIKDGVGNIQSFDFAIGNAGGTAEQALGSLENLASFMRTNPGGERFINSLGAGTRDANGEMLKGVAIMDNILARLKQMPYYRAKAYADAVGIDESTMQAYNRGIRPGTYNDLYKQAGLDPDKVAKDSKDFMNNLREMEADAGVLGAVFAERLAPAALAFMKILEGGIWIIEKLDQVTGGLTTNLIAVASALGIASKAAKFLGLDLMGLLAKGMAPLVMRIAVLVGEWLPALGDAIMAVAAMIEAGGIIAFGWVALILAAIVSLIYGAYELFEHWDDVAAFFGRIWEDICDAFTDAAEWILKQLGLMGPGTLTNAWAGITGFFEGIWNSLENTFKAGWDRIKPYVEAMAKLVKKDWAGALGAVAGGVIGFAVGGVPGAIVGAGVGYGLGHEANSPEGRKAISEGLGALGKGDYAKAGAQAMAFFKQAGWTAAQAAGIVANIGRESGFRSGAVGDGGAAFGIGQWHKDRQQAFAAWAGHDIHQSNLQEQLGFINYELTKGSEKMAGGILRATKDAFSAGAVVSMRYERPADRAGEANKRGGMAEAYLDSDTRRDHPPENYFAKAHLAPASTTKTIKIDHKSQADIHVHGSTTPEQTGKAVAGQQQRVNGDAVRNLKGALT